jgi:hypothetical protein
MSDLDTLIRTIVRDELERAARPAPAVREVRP